MRTLVWLLGLLTTGLLTAAEPVGWRMDGTGRFPDAKIVTDWAPDKNVVWTTPMPNWGNGSPVLVGDKLLVGAEPALLLCVSAADGKVLWQQANDYEQIFPKEELDQAKQALALQNQVRDLENRLNGNPTDLKLYGALADLCRQIADDPANAEKFALAQKLAQPRTQGINGYSSPTPVSDGLSIWVVTGLGSVGCYALDGTRKWLRVVEKPTHEWGHSASPVLADGKLIVHLNNKLVALDPATGNELWRTPGNAIWGTPLPVKIGGESAVVTSGGDLVRLRDGKIVARQVVALPWSSAIAQDGVVYFVDEGLARAMKLPEAMADDVKVEKLWEAKVHKERYYAAPLLHDGLLYAVAQGGQFSVLDAKDGKVLYQQNLNLGGTCFPSPVLAGDRLLIGSDSGNTAIVQPGREFKELGRCKLESFRGTPVCQGDRLYIRGMKALYCLGPGK